MQLYKNTYFQGTMSESTADLILKLNKMHVIKPLKQAIYACSSEEIEHIITTKSSIIPKVYGELKDEQTLGVGFMLLSKRCYLGDSTGLGKTVQTAAFCNILSQQKLKQCAEPFRYLYLTKKTSVSELHRKLISFTGIYASLLSSAETVKVEKYLQEAAKYSLVATHDLITNESFLISCSRHPFDAVIIDECDFLKNPHTQIFKSTIALLKPHMYRIFLNATPLETSILNIFYPFSLLDENYMPSITEFKMDFCKKNEHRKIIDVKNADVLKKALTLRYMGKTRQKSGALFCDNHVYKYKVHLSPEQQKLKSKVKNKQCLFDFPSETSLMLEPTIQNTPKVACALDILKNKVCGEKVLIYCYYKKAQTFLTSVLLDAGYSVETTLGLTGSKYDDVVNNFVSGSTQILVTNGTRALDMQLCNHLILYTIPRNPADAKQVEGRMIRNRDIQGKNLYLIMMSDEEKTLDTVLSKRINMSDSVVASDYSLFSMAFQLKEPDERVILRNYNN